VATVLLSSVNSTVLPRQADDSRPMSAPRRRQVPGRSVNAVGIRKQIRNNRNMQPENPGGWSLNLPVQWCWISMDRSASLQPAVTQSTDNQNPIRTDQPL